MPPHCLRQPVPGIRVQQLFAFLYKFYFICFLIPCVIVPILRVCSLLHSLPPYKSEHKVKLNVSSMYICRRERHGTMCATYTLTHPACGLKIEHVFLHPFRSSTGNYFEVAMCALYQTRERMHITERFIREMRTPLDAR